MISSRKYTLDNRRGDVSEISRISKLNIPPPSNFCDWKLCSCEVRPTDRPRPRPHLRRMQLEKIPDPKFLGPYEQRQIGGKFGANKRIRATRFCAKIRRGIFCRGAHNERSDVGGSVDIRTGSISAEARAGGGDFSCCRKKAYYWLTRLRKSLTAFPRLIPTCHSPDIKRKLARPRICIFRQLGSVKME